MQNQKKYQNLFIILILTDIITSTWLLLFSYIDGRFKIVMEEQTTCV